MRHSSADQTLKVYMREIPEGVRTAVNELDKMYREHRRLAQEKKPKGTIQ
jgi:hypothetical protein